MADLTGRNVVIAGAAGGLGAVATAAFAAAGASLTLLGREQAKIEELAHGLKLPPERWLASAADVSKPAELAAVQQATQAKFGRVDVLLNLVGGWLGGKPVLQTSTADFDSMLAQHFYASYALLQTFVPAMLAQKWGRVLAVSSPNASRPPGKNSPYAVGKAAMETLMLSLAQELRGSGVTANLVLVRTIDVKHERQIKPSEENKGWTSPEEISATLLHLCSEEAGVINGTRIALFGEPF
jgi:NAD(P)-dependent dehydrogenase (short-subunit alcohol dehydrogenase family)